MKKFIETVNRLTQEFKDTALNEGFFLTAEFSTSKHKLHKKHVFLHKTNKTLSGVNWIIFYCSTCKYQNCKYPYHVRIEVSDTISIDEFQELCEEQ